jgi:hypothetical protein
MPTLLPPTRMRQCSASSRSFLRGPDGPCGGSTWTSPALRRSYRTRETAGQSKIRITKVSTVSGEPRVLLKIRMRQMQILVSRWMASRDAGSCLTGPWHGAPSCVSALPGPKLGAEITVQE